jgi:hypothetical protein
MLSADLAPDRRRALLSGVFSTTLATLLLEQLDARLLSVVTWYHLAFFAVSLAMLGMAAGAVAVFLAGSRLQGSEARRLLPTIATLFSASIVAGHLVSLWVPVYSLRAMSLVEFGSLGLATVSLGVPFFLSGVVVTVALTRVTREIGLLYGVDLLGAALGCLLVVPLLTVADLTSAVLGTAALAAFGARAFARIEPGVNPIPSTVLCAVLAIAAIGNAALGAPLSVGWSKGKQLDRNLIDYEGWNDHSYVIARAARTGKPFFWGRGVVTDVPDVEMSLLVIDGSAATPVTRWNGDPASIRWVRNDVTALPHSLRSGDTAVIGVGGGRDVLSAIWGGSRTVVGIEVNDQFIDILTGSHRDFARVADFPGVELVHDEARSFLTRESRRFDVIQMSLIDTWAATGAGAYSLSENGLYTLEAWRVFLDRLKPGGLLSVSRWFAPSDLSETSRLLSLAVAALLDRGIEDPQRHLLLASRGPVATLLVSVDPISDEDIDVVESVSRYHGFLVHATPRQVATGPRLASIIASRDRDELAVATQHEHFDYSPPTDERPYFFNLLKLGSFRQAMSLRAFQSTEFAGGVLVGNARATATLLALFAVALILAALLTGVPLWRRGLPAMGAGDFVASCSYFALIGMGYMLVQVPALQRFSLYLGHPTYTLSVVLFGMILFSGLGSFVSDRLRNPSHAIYQVPLVAALGIAGLAAFAQPLIEATIDQALWLRCAVVLILICPVSFFLGFCFPLGLRAVAARTDDATPWMWGINGAFGVVASVLSIVLSMGLGINSSWVLAAVLYASLALVARRLARGISI